MNKEKGLCCIPSAILFHIYSEQVFKEALDDRVGIKTGGENINNFRYADDTILFAEDLAILTKAAGNACDKYGSIIKVKKMKLMAISKDPHTHIHD